jgi:putative aminopeptidase FrvX
MSPSPRKAPKVAAKRARPTEATAKRARPAEAAAKRARPTEATAKRARPAEAAAKRARPAKAATKRARPAGVPQVLRDLLLARGPSGYESAPAGVWRDAASEFAQVSTDLVGTPLALVAPKHGKRAPARPAARRLLVMGHIDEIGLIVTHIDDDGYLWFREVGGWDAQILVGQRVVLDTSDGPVAGVVGKKPIHLLRDEERKKVADIRDMHIDVGARDGKQARELVRIGDVAVIDAQPVELPNGRLSSRALDNRLGSFVALEAARLIAEAGGAQWEIAAVAVAQEETTFGGSRTSAFALEPDAAIVIDVTHATDAPGIDVKQAGKHELGSGPVITRGSTLNDGVFELLFKAGEAEKIAFTVDASGRATGTDADAVHISRGGVPTGLVSIPIRYMHSPVELVQMDDVYACARLIAAAALRLRRDTSFAR